MITPTIRFAAAPLSAPSPAPVPADADAEGALSDLRRNGYRVSGGAGATPSAADLAAHIRSGDSAEMILPNSKFVWHIESPEDLRDCLLAESGRTALLDPSTQASLKLAEELKTQKVKFFSHAGNRVGIALKMGPLWLQRKDSLYASVNGGQQFKVTTLERLARKLKGQAEEQLAASPITVKPAEQSVQAVLENSRASVEALQQRIRMGNDELARIGKSISTINQRTFPIRQRIQENQQASQTLRFEKYAHARKSNLGGAIGALGLASAVFGLLVGTTHPAGVCLMSVGAAVAAGGGFVKAWEGTKASRKQRELNTVQERVNRDYYRLRDQTGNLMGLQRQQTEVGRMVEQSERKLRTLQKRLDIVEMAQAPHPQPGTVKVEQGSVRIGNLLVPRRQETPH